MIASHLLGDIARLALEVLESLHNRIVVQDGALQSTNRVQESLLQMPELKPSKGACVDVDIS